MGDSVLLHRRLSGNGASCVNCGAGEERNLGFQEVDLVLGDEMLDRMVPKILHGTGWI
jgi:hypothetical protein